MVEGLSHEAMSLALPEVSNRVSSDDDINWNSLTQAVPRQTHILYYQWVHSCQNEITGDLNLANPQSTEQDCFSELSGFFKIIVCTFGALN